MLQADAMKKAWIRSFGDPDVIELIETGTPVPKPGEVLVRATSIGMNRSDLDCRRGIYPVQPAAPCGIGHEAAGVVVEGAGDSIFKAGDRVGTLPGSSFVKLHDYGRTAEYFTTNADWLVKTPDSVSDAEAGAIWVNYLTAYGALIDVGRLQPGEVIVIAAAPGATGLAAIQFAKLAGAQVIATTRSAHKCERLLAAGADFTVNTSTEDYEARVLELTAGRGADFIFDPIGGPFVARHLDAVAQKGRVLLYGVLTYPEFCSFDPDVLINKHITLRGYNVDDPFVIDRAALAKAVEYITSGLNEDRLRLIIDSRFLLDEVVEAHRYAESDRQFGKILINP
ncbi:MAG: zinc-dependent alcohol dehydrogenase family protein [Gammaproteobacteria bacterium]|nr:zinc-dependent alcohol dehydrogenase family protein [Gammaproteobacteria bacterium]MDE0366552.1 zinc-dependent alcohol dehydrogenase family protein [Gammaproteobacteria bacterium]